MNVKLPLGAALALCFFAGVAAAQSKSTLLVIGHPTAHSWKNVDHPAFITKVIDPDLEPLTAAAYTRFARIMGAAGDPLYVAVGSHMEPFAASGPAGLSQFLDRVAAADRDVLIAEAGLVVRRHLLRKAAAPAEPAVDLRVLPESPLYDHIGGGFFRCMRDSLPCFDKSLVDQASFAVRYIEAWKKERDPFFADIARATLDNALAQMQNERGLFVAGTSAKSIVARGGPELLEGGYYVWSADEIRKILGPELGAIVSFHYDVKEEGNVPGKPDFFGKNLLLPRPRSETRSRFGLTEKQLSDALSTARGKLLEIRSKRPEPPWHTPVVTAYNAQMISALARAAVAFDEPHYGEAALSTARVLQPKKLTPLDHALFTQALLDLYQVTFDVSLLARAMALVPGEPERVPEPVAALAPVENVRVPSITAMRQIIIAGNRAAPETIALLRTARQSQPPDSMIFLASSERARAALSQWVPNMKHVAVPETGAVATVCDQTCRTPTSDLARLEAWLK